MYRSFDSEKAKEAVSRDFPRLTKNIDKLLKSSAISIVVCIDGNCGAGKSTLAYLLSRAYECNVFHTDDFFLRPEQRSGRRMGTPGGNIDYERLGSEVLAKVAGGQDFTYRKFNCGTMSLEEPIEVKHTRLNIIEGAYSLHPELSSYYNLKVFLKTSYINQIERIRARNGPQRLEHFISEWIPRENAYFEAFDIEKSCDLVFDV